MRKIMPADAKDARIIALDLSNVTGEEAYLLFVDYKQVHAFPYYSSPINCIGQDNTTIAEAKASKPLEQVKFEIVGKYLLRNWQFASKKAINDTEIALVVPYINQNLQMVTRDMEIMGYFNSINKMMVIKGYNYVQMQFKPKFQDSVLNDIKNIGLLFHLTLASNIDSIKSNGFVPSSENNLYYYKNKVYFIKGTTSIPDIISITIETANASHNDPNDYCIMVIDTDLIPNDIEFYYGPSLLQSGVFTETTIPPNVIKKVIPFPEYMQYVKNIGY